MTAKRQDLPALEKGAEYNLNLRCTDKAGVATDFTGASAVMQVRPYLESNEIIIELSTANSRLVLSSGLITLSLTDAETKDIVGTSFVYDVLVTFSAGHSKRIMEGSWPLSNGVTR